MTTLSLRGADPSDAGIIVEMHALPHVRNFLSAPSLEMVSRGIRSFEVEHFIVLADGKPSGFIMFAELESWLYEIRRLISRREGLGIASYALSSALDHIFRERSAHRVYLEVGARNDRARRLYERHGFVYEGTYRDGFRNPVSGAFEDLCIYGMLADEFKSAARP